MRLTEREKEQHKALIDAGEAVAGRYRATLFAQPHEAELIWPGKTSEVTNIVLPFHVIEQIDDPVPKDPKPAAPTCSPGTSIRPAVIGLVAAHRGAAAGPPRLLQAEELGARRHTFCASNACRPIATRPISDSIAVHQADGAPSGRCAALLGARVGRPCPEPPRLRKRPPAPREHRAASAASRAD